MTELDLPQNELLRRGDLAGHGLSDRHARRLVRDGVLLKARRGVFLRADCVPSIATAARAGGRLTCVSALQLAGVFVHGGATDQLGNLDAVHVQVASHASRLPPRRAGTRLHWVDVHRQQDPRHVTVGVFDALVQAASCQSPRATIASIDSALYTGALHDEDLDELFEALPRRLRRLRGLVDRRAESGPETLVRLMLRGLGARPELQVTIARIGRVDLLVDGWLVVECDSRAHHSSWDEIRKDRWRDQELAALGYAVYRPIAEDILYNPEAVLRALKGLLFEMRRR